MAERLKYDASRATSVQLGRLFGARSKLATGELKTKAQWRRALRCVLLEIEKYLDANVDTDEFHRMCLYSGLVGAGEALKQDDFWPGYVEGITRIALTLLGDYPDHRRRKPGRKDEEHYKLDRERSLNWGQTPEQRFRALMHAGEAGFPKLSRKPLDVLGEFRDEHGFRLDHAAFLEWYRVHFAEDYATVFR